MPGPPAAPLKKNGKGYVCRCPFPDHEDNTPSFIVTPSENLWNCFGCNRGGDIFKFDELYFKLDFIQSVNKHESGTPSPKPAKPKPPTKQKELSVKERKFLARVVSYYQHTLAEDKTGADYLKNERGITDNQSLTDFGAGLRQRHAVEYPAR